MMLTRRQAGICGVVGGLLWAVTPLRQPIFDAGRTPDEGETFFRSYNVVLIAIAILLTVALVRLRQDGRGVNSRLFGTGWWMMLLGHVLLAVGSLPAVVFGDQARSLVGGGQDLGFLGAMIAGLGGLLAGVSALRRHGTRAGLAWWLLLLTLPLGFLLVALLAAIGAHEDFQGLPLTILYGGAWIALGWSWIHDPDGYAASPGRASRASTRN